MFCAETITSVPVGRRDDRRQRGEGHAQPDVDAAGRRRSRAAARARTPHASSTRLVHLPVARDVGRAVRHRRAPPLRAAACPRATRAMHRRLSRGGSPCRPVRTARGPPPSRRRRRPSFPRRFATASATPRVPAANGSISNAPIGPFQKTVPACSISRAYASTVAWPTSSPIQPSGTSTPSSSRRSASASKLSPITRSSGSRSRQRVSPSARSSAAPRQLDPLLLDQRVARRLALRAEEAEAHRAADQDRVGDVHEAVDQADLVADLRPAEHDDERPRGVLDQSPRAWSPPSRAAGRPPTGRCSATPAVEACARWAAPNASFT